MGELWRRLYVFVVILSALLFVTAPARAQQTPLGAVRIGVVLPHVPDTAAAVLRAAVARAARQGAVLADEEFGFNSELLGIDFSVLTETASGADVVAAADLLVGDGAIAIIGGFTTQEASALSTWAKTRGVPFMNVGSSADSLRHELCSAATFHLEPSAAMYLDAFVGWYVRSGFRQWYFVRQDTDEGRSQYERILWSMRERHFGAREVGRTVIKPGASGGPALAAAIRSSGADVLMLLLSASDQLRILGELDTAGITVTTTGFPYPETQTRAFFAASAKAAPTLGVGHRAVAWEPTIDAYGAREYNARYFLRWNEPMESPAWAVFHAVKIFYEAALFGGSISAESIMAYMLDANSVFDLHKGVGVSFRPWDRQLRQSLYLVKINANAASAAAMGLLVGELPAIYMPGTELIERLDQLGDLAAQSRCAQ